MHRGTRALASQNPARSLTILHPCQREAPLSPCYRKLAAFAFSRISSDQAVPWAVASSPVPRARPPPRLPFREKKAQSSPRDGSGRESRFPRLLWQRKGICSADLLAWLRLHRSEEHTSELQS